MEILDVESREAGEFYLAYELNAKRVKLAQPILLKLLTQLRTHLVILFFKKGPVKKKKIISCSLI